MLKFKVELDLGNEAMLTAADVSAALGRALRVTGTDSLAHLVEGDGGVLRDDNGNRVGVWGVERERGTDDE